MRTRLVPSGLLLLALCWCSQGQAPSPRAQALQLFLQTEADFIRDHDQIKAKHGFLRVTQIDPGYGPAWFNLGVLAEGERNWTGAQAKFREYLRLAPHGPDAERAEREISLLSEYANGLIDEKATKYDGAIQKARAFLAINLFRESIAEAGYARDMDDTRWEAYAVISLALAKQNKNVEALNWGSLAVEHAPAEKRAQVRDALASQMAAWDPAVAAKTPGVSRPAVVNQMESLFK